MPHVVIKLRAGRSDETKSKLTRALADTLMETLGVPETSVSVAIEDVDGDAWMETVYAREILPNMESLYKKPGYGTA